MSMRQIRQQQRAVLRGAKKQVFDEMYERVH